MKDASYSYGDLNELYVHKEKEDGTLQTINLDKHETFVLIDSLLANPEYQERAIQALLAKELIRLNHNI